MSVMAKVSVTINKRKYEIACDDGQEAHLVRLAQYVDRRVDELVAAVGQERVDRLGRRRPGPQRG